MPLRGLVFLPGRVTVPPPRGTALIHAGLVSLKRGGPSAQEGARTRTRTRPGRCRQSARPLLHGSISRTLSKLTLEGHEIFSPPCERPGHHRRPGNGDRRWVDRDPTRAQRGVVGDTARPAPGLDPKRPCSFSLAGQDIHLWSPKLPPKKYQLSRGHQVVRKPKPHAGVTGRQPRATSRHEPPGTSATGPQRGPGAGRRNPSASSGPCPGAETSCARHALCELLSSASTFTIIPPCVTRVLTDTPSVPARAAWCPAHPRTRPPAAGLAWPAHPCPGHPVVGAAVETG